MFAEILQGQALLGAKMDLALDYLKTLCSGQNLRNHVPSGEIKLPLTSLADADTLDNRLRENTSLKQELVRNIQKELNDIYEVSQSVACNNMSMYVIF